MKPSLDSVYRRRPDIRFRRVKGEWVVIRQKAAEVLVLNEWAGRVLELLDGERTLAEVVGQLSEEYDEKEDVVKGDVVTFASELLDADLSEEVSGGNR